MFHCLVHSIVLLSCVFWKYDDANIYSCVTSTQTVYFSPVAVIQVFVLSFHPVTHAVVKLSCHTAKGNS